MTSLGRRPRSRENGKTPTIDRLGQGVKEKTLFLHAQEGLVDFLGAAQLDQVLGRGKAMGYGGKVGE